MVACGTNGWSVSIDEKKKSDGNSLICHRYKPGTIYKTLSIQLRLDTVELLDAIEVEADSKTPPPLVLPRYPNGYRRVDGPLMVVVTVGQHGATLNRTKLRPNNLSSE